MRLIDTNILVYASVPFFDEHHTAKELLADIPHQRTRYCITWINVFEYLRVVTHPKLIKPKPLSMDKALDNIKILLSQPRISRVDAGPDHLLYFEDIVRRVAPVKGNFVHDCRIAAIMKEHGIHEILTRDSDFMKIPDLSVINPFD